jgi:hypothetical protein
MKQIFTAALIITVAASCNKTSVSDPAFLVTAASTAIHANDTTKFAFSGNPGYITFYSGEPGHVYENRNRVTGDGTPLLQFTSYMQTGAQANSLQLMISTNFSGSYDSAGVSNASWTDISSRATLSAGADNTASGVINLADFLNDGKPVYFAFKYTGVAGSAQRTWTIKNFVLNNVLKADSSLFPVLTLPMIDSAWKPVNVKNTAISWTFSTTQLQVKGNTTTGSVATEAWIVSKALALNRATPDMGVQLKNMTIALSAYTYIYKTAGTYTASFDVSNTTKYDSKSDVKQIQITVAP